MCLATFANPNAFPIEEANGVEPKQFWDNEFDGFLHKDCGPYEAFFRVRSEHSNKHEDRRWRWDCGDVSPTCRQIACFAVKYLC